MKELDENKVVQCQIGKIAMHLWGFLSENNCSRISMPFF